MKNRFKINVQPAPTIRAEVFKTLRHMIVSGGAVPGTKLIEGKLAQKLGVSRTPVREALHSLEMEGLIESVPRVGYIVRGITLEDVEEIIELRIALETLAAKRASAIITTGELKRLERYIIYAEKCIERNDTKNIIKYNTMFHEGICIASRSKRIIAINLSLRDHMLRFRELSSLAPETAREAVNWHRQIFEAIKKADAESIERTIRSHLAWTKEDIVRKIKSLPGNCIAGGP